MNSILRLCAAGSFCIIINLFQGGNSMQLHAAEPPPAGKADREKFSRLKADLESCRARLNRMFPENKLPPEIADRFFLADQLMRSIETGSFSGREELRRAEMTAELFLSFFHEKERLLAEERTGNSEQLNLMDFGAAGDGRSDDAGAFRAVLAEAARRQGKPVTIVIPPGNYLLKQIGSIRQTADLFDETTTGEVPENRSGHLILNRLKNLTLKGDGAGAVLIFADSETNGIVIAGCENVKLENLELRRVRPPFMQGTILEAIPAGKAVIWRADPGFMTPDDPAWNKRSSCAQSYDPATGKIVENASHVFYDGKYEKLDGGRWKLYLERLYRPGLRKGLKLLLPCRNNKVYSLFTCRSRFCLFDRISIPNAQAAAFLSLRCFANEYRDCRIVPDPGAWLSTNADGLHCADDYFGVHVRNCEFRNLGDDAFNTYTKGLLLHAADRNSIFSTAVLPAGSPVVVLSPEDGSRKAEFLSLGGGPATRKKRELQETRADRNLPELISYELLSIASHSAQVLLSQQHGFSKLKMPDLAFMPLRSGIGTVVRDSRFSGNRNNALVIQTAWALLEGNRIENFTAYGIFAGALMHPWQEGYSPCGVFLRNNCISDVAVGIRTQISTQNAAPAKEALLRNFIQEGNRIIACRRNAVELLDIAENPPGTLR